MGCGAKEGVGSSEAKGVGSGSCGKGEREKIIVASHVLNCTSIPSNLTVT